MALQPEERDLVADQLRVWEVRRYCQVKPSLVQYTRGDLDGVAKGAPTDSEARAPDPALAALLRCLVHELGVDLAMISLLDADTQYFISGASTASVHSAEVTLESTKWYGCDAVLHEGGLCQRTITQPTFGHFEVFDMSQSPVFKDIPLVNGETASFRHYFGVPLTTPNGHNIGSLFTMNGEPSRQGLSDAQKEFTVVTASHIVQQLTLAVSALENVRAQKLNASLGKVLEESSPDLWLGLSSSDASKRFKANSQVYKRAAKLLAEASDFDGVVFQSASRRQQSTILGEHRKKVGETTSKLPSTSLERLLESFPLGAVFHRSPGNHASEYAASTPSEITPCYLDVGDDLRSAFPDACQVTFTPIYDTYHEQTAAVAFGWSDTYSRVYTAAKELPSLSAFCATVMAQHRRAYARAMDQKKSDFLATISHEMRSPLHGTLACLELLADTPNLDSRQLELIENATASGMQLLDNFDHILKWSEIAPSPDDMSLSSRRSLSEDDQPYATTPTVQGSGPSTLEEDMDLESLCQNVIEATLERMQTISDGLGRHGAFNAALADGGEASSAAPLVLLDTNLQNRIGISEPFELRTVLQNLLANAIKYTPAGGVVRVSLAVDAGGVTLTVADTGKGMSEDYLNHQLYKAFSKEDVLSPGVGLGLTLAMHNVDLLNCTLDVESDQEYGSTFTVSIPRRCIVSDRLKLPSTSRPGVLLDEQDADISHPRKVELYVPECWQRAGTALEERCAHLFWDSLSSIAREASSEGEMKLDQWSSDSNGADVVLVPKAYVAEFEQARLAAGQHFIDRKVIILDHEIRDHLSNRWDGTRRVGARDYVVKGLVCARKIRHALIACFMHPASPPEASARMVLNPDSELAHHPPARSREEFEDPSPPNDLPVRTKSAPKADSPKTAEPRLLLVDDNAVNLKVLTAFAKKFVSSDRMVTAGGGKEAVESFAQAVREGNHFNIIFMDLSMPFSGFDATRVIRDREVAEDLQRSLIVALTGLVSERDREEAFAAGVDEYVTKPTRAQEVNRVIQAWKQEKLDAGGVDQEIQNG